MFKSKKVTWQTLEFKPYRDGYVCHEIPRKWSIGPKKTLKLVNLKEGANSFQTDKGEVFLPYPADLINSDKWECVHCSDGFIIMKPKS